MTTVTDTPTRADVSATPTTMRAAVVKTAGAPLVVTDVQAPPPGPRQALVKVITSGVCHTDLHAAHGDGPHAPLARQL